MRVSDQPIERSLSLMTAASVLLPISLKGHARTFCKSLEVRKDEEYEIAQQGNAGGEYK